MSKKQNNVGRQIKENIAEGKRLCNEIEELLPKLEEREAIIKALHAVGIEVENRPKDLLKQDEH